MLMRWRSSGDLFGTIGGAGPGVGKWVRLGAWLCEGEWGGGGNMSSGESTAIN